MPTETADPIIREIDIEAAPETVFETLPAYVTVAFTLSLTAVATISLSPTSFFVCSTLRCRRAAWRMSSFIPPRN